MQPLCLLWIFISLQTACGAYTPTADSAIRTATVGAATYDTVSRPDAQTNVKVGLSILAIDTLDLKNQQFTTAGWLTFEWTDSRLTWVTASNNNIESIFVKPGTVWKPELLIDNELDELGVINDANLHLRLQYDGTLEWEPPLLFTTHCQVDITYYPYDSQKCGIKVVSWGYAIDEVSLEALSTAVNLEDFEKNGEWSVDKTSVELANLTETSSSGQVRIHPILTFWLYLSRRTQFYDMNVMIPIVITSLLVILVFIVPVESGEKLSYVLTVFLALAVLLTLIADALPSTSVSTSVLGVYLTFVLILTGVACLLTVIVMTLYHKDGSPPSSSASAVFCRVMAKVTCTKLERKPTSRPTSATVNKVVPAEDVDGVKDRESGVAYDVDWKTVSAVLDRFCFIVFAIVTIAVNVSFIVALVAGGLTNAPE